MNKFWGVYNNNDKRIIGNENGPTLFKSRSIARKNVSDTNTSAGSKIAKVVAVTINIAARNHAGEWLPIA